MVPEARAGVEFTNCERAESVSATKSEPFRLLGESTRREVRTVRWASFLERPLLAQSGLFKQGRHTSAIGGEADTPGTNQLMFFYEYTP